MGKIDSDYLWLQERPRTASYLRRIALVLLIPLIASAAWLGTTSQQPDGTQGATHADGKTPQQSMVDARVGARRGVAAPTESAKAVPVAENKLEPDATNSTDTPVSTAPIDIRHAPEYDATSSDTSRAASAQAPLETEPKRPPEFTPTQPRKPASASTQANWHNFTIRAGDTLSIAFNRNGLSYGDSLKIAHMPEFGDRFTRGLKAGDTLRIKADGEGSVQALDYPLDALHTLHVRRDGDDFAGEIVLAEVEHRKAYATGVIDTSFYVDALEAGLSDRQIMALARIFGWDIDFALDIRPGDRFVVVYDELFRDGEKVSNGDILAASFINRGDDVQAVRYTNAEDESAYYSPSGRSMKKAFIRTPVDYTRISSGFNLSRRHPILNRIRRHSGTDYAAPSGTPIKATGNGRIVFRGRRGGYGNMIIIKHDSRLTTRYGHMSGFASGFGVGSRVEQGEVIGYVGMSGLATGPHLHYEFRVNGEPKDPERVPLPKANPMPEKYMADFKHRTAPLLSQLKTLTHTNVARAENSNGSRSN